MVMLGYASWCLFTISYKNELFRMAGAIGTLFMAFVYLVVVVLVTDEESRVLAVQINRISVCGFGIALIVWLKTGYSLLQQHDFCYLSVELLWLLLFGMSLFYQRKLIKPFQLSQTLKQRNSLWILALLLVTAVFLYEPDALQFKWDGLLYYLTCKELRMDSISSLAVYGHIAQTYGALMKLATLLIGDTAIAMTGVNLILMFVGVLGFYALIKECVPGRREGEYALAAAVYAWSPFLLGMVYYHNLDFACQCLLPLLLYFLYKEKWIYFSIFSLLFCFTKEPAIIVYASVCGGVVLGDFLQDRRRSIAERIIRLLRVKRYYLMAIPGVLWLVTYKLLGPWSAGEGGISVDLTYIIEKLKVLYILNFNWIFVLLSIIGLILLAYRKEMKRLSFLLPVLFGQIGLTLFCCLFKTVNHPRYNCTNQVTIYFMTIVILMFCFKDITNGILQSGIAILLLVSSFKTIDPLSLSCFPNCRIGTETMITTMDIPLGDGMIYNRQMLWLEGAISRALEDAFSESDVVCFPTSEDNAYFFDGMAEVGEIHTPYRMDTEYWDTDKRKRVPEQGETTQSFTVYQLTEKEGFPDASYELEGRGNLLYTSYTGNQYAEIVKSLYSNYTESTYSYRGWEIRRLSFENEMRVNK